MTQLLRLIYCSEPARAFDEPDIERILDTSRKNNRRLNITGLLCQNDRLFLQLLEGGERDVMTLYSRIADDPRHSGVRLLHIALTDVRLMEKWAMSYYGKQALPPFGDELLNRLSVIDEQGRAARALMRQILPKLKGQAALEETSG